MNKNREMAAASLGMIAIGIIARIFGLVRDQLVAATFGASATTDAYFLANVLPTILAGALGHALATGLMPPLMGHLANGKRDTARRLVSAVLGFTLLASALLSITGLVASGWIMKFLAADYTPVERTMATLLSQVLFPTLTALTLFSVLSAALNANKNFWIPASGGVLLNLLSILGILMRGHLGITALAIGVLVGCVGQMALAWWGLKRFGLAVAPRLQLRDSELRRVFVLALPVLGTHVVGNIYQVVERGLAARLQQGAISALAYANRIINIPLNLLGLTIATAAYPLMAQKSAIRDEAGFARATGFSVRLTMFLTMPVSVGLIVLRQPIVEVLFKRGAFDQLAADYTANALFYYALGLLVNNLGTVLCKACYAVEDMKSTVYVGIETAALNVALDWLLSRSMGYTGLALANTLSNTFYAVAIYWAVLRRSSYRERKALNGESFSGLWQSLLASVIVGTLAYVLLRPGVSIRLSTLNQLWRIGWIAGISGVLYAVLLWIMRVEEIQIMFQWFRQRLGREKRRS